MTLWFVFALMTVAAIFAVLWPLSRGTASKAGGSEAVVYKDQLAEIDRDVAAGQIGVSEAEAARVEISRRLLAAADSERDLPAQSNPGLRRSSAVLAWWVCRRGGCALPLARIAATRRFPACRRTRAADANQPLENLVAQVEAHLEKNPTDGRGWSVLAPVLARLGRFDDAVRAFRNSIAYNGDSAERRSDLGEALVGSAGGVVTADAKAEFERAVALNADDPKANYFLGLAAEQDGRSTEAAAIWRDMLARAPAMRRGGRWSRPRWSGSAARRRLRCRTTAMAAAKDMNEADRGAMIRGMVDRLATRLKQNGDDVEGWLRLVRAYMVMGERDKAMGAVHRGAPGSCQ